MLKAKLLVAGTLAGWLTGACALANPPSSHHSVQISATIVEDGKNGQSIGHTTRVVDNASILKAAIQFEGIPGVKPAQLDIVEEDDTGEVEIVYRAAPHDLFYLIGNYFNTTETTGFATTEPNGFTQYRIYSNYSLELPNEGRVATVGIEFINHLNTMSAFKSSTAIFRGGSATNATFQFVVSGRLTTGNRVYVYEDEAQF